MPRIPRLGMVLTVLAAVDVGAVPTAWRAAEEVDTLPVGAEVTLTGDFFDVFWANGWPWMAHDFLGDDEVGGWLGD